MIHGNNVIVTTPFDKALEVDEAGFCRQLDFVVDSGADGVIILGTTGEFFSLDRKEKGRLVKLAAERLRGKANLIVGVGDTCLREAIALAQLGKEHGADAILAPAPYFMAWMPSGITEYFVALARDGGVDMMIYDGGGGTAIPLTILQEVADRAERFKYLKLTTRDVAKVRQVPAVSRGRVVVFGGEDTLIIQELLAGAAGVATAAGLLNAGAINTVIRCVREKALDQAQAAHDRWLAPQAIVTGSIHQEFIQCFKAALKMMKIIDHDLIRPPLAPLCEDRRIAIELMLRAQGKLA
jgi:4-hydroxy-tetrahydrodipicolinate synthase